MWSNEKDHSRESAVANIQIYCENKMEKAATYATLSSMQEQEFRNVIDTGEAINDLLSTLIIMAALGTG